MRVRITMSPVRNQTVTTTCQLTTVSVWSFRCSLPSFPRLLQSTLALLPRVPLADFV
nr:MAG TPA: hypothetical protein [Caudoviricetes sp.]